MEMVASAEEKPSLVYYLPHHGVIRESSKTTKFRVVFNGSQKSSNGVSLNDCLHVGSKLLPDLIDVITRWRTHAIVFSADMEKMFRQILLHPLDRNLQRILWRHPSRSKLEAHRLSTVTYGLASAPYLTIRVICQLALDEKSRFPLAAEALSTDVYVDDVFSGANEVDTALAKQHEIIEALKAGGFSSSNLPALLSHLSPSDLAAGASFVVRRNPRSTCSGSHRRRTSIASSFNLSRRRASRRIRKGLSCQKSPSSSIRSAGLFWSS